MEAEFVGAGLVSARFPVQIFATGKHKVCSYAKTAVKCFGGVSGLLNAHFLTRKGAAK